MPQHQQHSADKSITASRVEAESFHDIAICHAPNRQSKFVQPFPTHAQCVRLVGSDSIYPIGSFVGKSTLQPYRKDNGDLDSEDREVYEKWSQAVSSAHEVIDAATSFSEPRFTFVCPVLTV